MEFLIFIFSLVEDIKNEICHILRFDEDALLYSEVFIISHIIDSWLLKPITFSD